jgi:hypothetical protein
MQVVADSRVIKNLIRDLLENKQDPQESISFLNTTNDDIDLYDFTSKKYKIVYPGTIGKIERPKDKLFIGLNNFTNVDDFSPDNYLHKIIVARKDLRRQFLIIEGPTLYGTNIKTYTDELSRRWVNKQMKKTDRIILIRNNSYIIHINNANNSSNYLPYLLLFALIFTVILIISVYIINGRYNTAETSNKG